MFFFSRLGTHFIVSFARPCNACRPLMQSFTTFYALFFSRLGTAHFNVFVVYAIFFSLLGTHLNVSCHQQHNQQTKLGKFLPAGKNRRDFSIGIILVVYIPGGIFFLAVNFFRRDNERYPFSATQSIFIDNTNSS